MPHLTECLARTALVVVPLTLALAVTCGPRPEAAPSSSSSSSALASDARAIVEVDLDDLCGDAAALAPAAELDVTCPDEQVEPEPGEPAAAGPGTSALHLVYDGKLVITADVDLRWAAGAVHHRLGEGEFRAWQGVADERLPPAILALRGTQVVIHGEGASTCVAEVGELSIYAEEVGDIFAWSEEIRPSAAGRRAHARELLGEPLALVAGLVGAEGCPHGVAWPVEAAPAITYAPLPLADDARAHLLAQVHEGVAGEPEYAGLRRLYRAYLADLSADERAASGTWSSFADRRLGVELWREVGGPRMILAAGLRDEYVGCGYGFEGEAAWLFEVTPNGLVRLPQAGAFDLIGVIDADRDGALELVSRAGGTLRLAGDVDLAEGARAFTVPFVGCPC